MLEDLSRKYIELRGEEALCYAVPHLSVAHPHVHLVFSGTRYKSSRTLRLDHAAFRRVRCGLETYQAARYPELRYSLVYSGGR